MPNGGELRHRRRGVGFADEDLAHAILDEGDEGGEVMPAFSILARALADARRSRDRANLGQNGPVCQPFTVHGDFTAERVGPTTRRLHQRVRLATLYRIDTWCVV